MSDFKELVKNLYTSKNRELTPEKFDYIQKTYTGKEQDFVKNFYATIGEDLTEEKLNYINDTYLKKKNLHVYSLRLHNYRQLVEGFFKDFLNYLKRH